MEQTPRSSESGHWYSRTGAAVYEVPSADGKRMVVPDIRHARRLGLVPGFTGINRVLYSFGLERYKIRQAILAALTLPRKEGENDDDYFKRLDEDRQAHAKGRADEGVEIHAAVQSHLEGKPYDPKWAAQVKGTEAVLEKLPESFIGDFKTKESIEGKQDKELYFDDHVMQLACYARGIYSGHTSRLASEDDFGKYVCELSFAHNYGYGGKVDVLRLGRTPGEWPLVSIIISVKEPGLVRFKVWSEDEIKRGLALFDSCLELWKLKNRYRSEWR